MILSRGWGRPKETHVVEDAEGREALSKITWEIVHVTKTQEQIDAENEPLQIEHKKQLDGEGDDVAVERNGVKMINGNGSGNGSGNGHGPPSEP
jgi:hypothetical protein